MSKITLLQCSDLHFGRDADLAQIAGLEGLAADLAPSAVAVAGDLTQRARHGEFQRALEFVQALRRLAPTIAAGGVPVKVGNEVIGAVGVGGAPGGHLDEQCANAGIAKVAELLK